MLSEGDRPDCKAAASVSIVVAFPSTAIFGQQSALAFHEVGQLERYETTLTWKDHGVLSDLIDALPLNIRNRLLPQLRRRALTELPPGKVREARFWEIMRTAAAHAGVSEILVDQIWDRMSHNFTRGVGNRLGRETTAIYAYEYTALEAFLAAKERGIRTILDYPSLDSREFERQQDEEKARFPELMGPHETYFRERFEARQTRRDTERALADLIITNSSVTWASHVAAGAPADRTIVVPYGAPPTIHSLATREIRGPLRLIWAGTFSIRKGAHYFAEALRSLRSHGSIEADVYGAVTIPDRVRASCPPFLRFHGSVPRARLFAAFDAADALVFPTLSDGFGMVVTEAFARGLPVITTPRAGASDFVCNHRNGLLVPAGDANALAEAISWCADNRGALAAMRPTALETAQGWQWSDYRSALRAAVNGMPFETPSSHVLNGAGEGI